MPRPINKQKALSSVVQLPGQLYNLVNTVLDNSNPRFNMVLEVMRNMQSAFDRIKPLLPPNNGVTAQDWDDVALEHWGAVPIGGVVPAVMAAAAAGNVLGTAYAVSFHPAVASSLYALNTATGLIADPRTMVIGSTEMAMITPELTELRDALEPIAEQI